MSLIADLDRIALQEQRLQFDHFDADTAWTLGNRLREAALTAGHALAIEIQFHGFPLFHCAMPGTTPENADWLRRKRNMVQRFHKSSYAMALFLLQRGSTLAERYSLPGVDYVAAGGGFPLRLRGVGVIGSVCVSGLMQRDDHEFIVSVLAQMLAVPQAEVALADQEHPG
ncbi:MAG: hypothetical protein CGU28_13285 [Candidatus Dactylopiibacterium carminicum]|uniref:UPF0303 protein BGI27_14345 n=1 Tax=Candidatus Dactylopiibacterium carminicum TaxID=857335 RepID=A0A272EPA2_9RHOO|nr:heme-degrading domain-containing protein [Candidatus Dactylopiibacterium carminicum]KAF7598232.1 heme-degrading domain-containing protein [Candidatus Dactylopiibacterium carminicum]PAS91886.1 MAG: hypothetical protein CGU29_13975 [Candidatus Dactylopiibacterium carminicum]PAS94862.1 MAG: hypothetical protein CGU28_13285 [Candidatus Dactylopiibacterium carminicum]PAS97075.1 MAG: hypothetical protein BSR46_14380 [Candidatus Dactylopiibacterium carminicum]